MRILMVTPYLPLRDGIAAYAVQSVARLRAEGHEVEVLSPGPSAAHHHLHVASRRGPLALARRVRGYDKVIVQFYPGLFHSSSFSQERWASASLGVAAAFAWARDVEVRVHESDATRARESRLIATVERLMWRAATRVVVHTEVEREAFHRDYGLARERIELAPHGADFVRRTTIGRAEARARLGIPADELMFLSIGFLQPHKGFDRAIRAFGPLGRRGCRLDVVGSLRVEEPAYVEHLEELRSLAAATPGASLTVGFVSDEEFDEWVVASDVVVLPYREIWSSSVMERATLYDRPVIATSVGGLAAQARPDTILVRTDEELAEAMRKVAGDIGATQREWNLGDRVDRAAVMAEIRARAAEQRSGPVVPSGGARGQPGPSTASAWDVGPLHPPDVGPRRSPAGVVKRIVRRLDGWQLHPVLHHVELLRQTVVRVGARLDEQAVRVDDRLDGLVRSVEGLRLEVESQGKELASARSDVGLLLAEARNRLQEPRDEAAPSALASRMGQRLSELYDQFEAGFRGTHEEITERQRIYLADVAPLSGSGAPVLDVGCGRGEWLQLLADNGIPAYGVDTNAAFAELSRQRGLDVRVDDALRHLQGLPEGSLGAVTAFHVVEHVDLDDLVDLVDSSSRALLPGGLIILETPNPTNLVVGSASFYIDPTHHRPVHPHFLKFLLAARGFVDVEIRLLHPSSEPHFEIPELEGADAAGLERMVEYLNQSFFGPQDYAVVGRRPSGGSSRE